MYYCGICIRIYLTGLHGANLKLRDDHWLKRHMHTAHTATGARRTPRRLRSTGRCATHAASKAYFGLPPCAQLSPPRPRPRAPHAMSRTRRTSEPGSRSDLVPSPNLLRGRVLRLPSRREAAGHCPSAAQLVDDVAHGRDGAEAHDHGVEQDDPARQKQRGRLQRGNRPRRGKLELCAVGGGEGTG